MTIIKDLISVDIVTYGGEDMESGCNNYGIQFLDDDISLELNPKQALRLYLTLGEHLKTNGHKL